MNEIAESQVDAVSELLLQWEESRSRGESATADELCRNRPDLRDELARRIHALEAVYRIPNRPSKDTDLEDIDTISSRTTSPNVPGFEVLGVLGRGGMGVVYKARHQRLNRLCALKMLRYDGLAGPTERLRFRIEAEAVAALQHPHIVQLYDVGEIGDAPYIVLEYIDGPTLAEQIRGKSVATTESVELVKTLAQAIDYSHRRGIIHRDLKPGNILLASVARGPWSVAKSEESPTDHGLPTTDYRLPKITDFGLAKRLRDAGKGSNGSPHTATGAVFGTPAYMAPEQALGRTREVGPASDVYSLGAILYELLTGRPPFQADSVLELLEQVRSQEPAPPRRLRPYVPSDLETICLKCLEKDPDKRYSSAGALADDLQRFQNHEPITARKVGWVEQSAKWARRRPAVAALLGTVLTLLIVMAVGGTTLAIIAMRATRDAVKATEDEKVAKVAAETRDAEKSAVLKFVENQIFAAARPLGQMGGLGRDVSLRRAVEAAVPYVDKSFADKPLIEARLRLSLGTSFYYLSDGPKSAEQNERARELYTMHLGPNDPDTLKSMSNLAISYDMLGRYDDALALRKETLERRRATLGPAHNDTVASINNLAVSYENRGQHSDALELRREVVELDTANLGPNHPDTLRSMSNLANSHAALGEYEDAFVFHEKVLAHRRVVLGSEHPDTLLSMLNVAMDLTNLKRPSEALQLLQETLALQQVHLGHDHSHTLITMNNMGVSLAELGRHEEALDQKKKTLALREAKHGSRAHPDTLKSMYTLALSYTDLKQYQQALDLHQETLTIRKSTLHADHPEIMWSMKEVASCLVQLDRGTEAVPIIDECVRRAASAQTKPTLLRQAIELRLRHFEKANDADGCRTTAAMWEQLNRTDADSLYTAACLRAVTAAVLRATSGVDSFRLADEEDVRAMDWLRKAFAAGYNNAAHIAEDKDLDALRDREDFKKLVAELGTRKGR